jgi:diaminopimelate epimerase
VSPPGGDLVIVVPDEGPATLTGPVDHEFATELEVPGT